MLHALVSRSRIHRSRVHGATLAFGAAVALTAASLDAAAATAAPVRFNEVRANDAGADDAEFVELIGPAGLDLEGWRIEHRNGAGSSDGPVFSQLLSGSLAASGGHAACGTELGLMVIGADAVPERHLTLAGGLQNGPDGMALFDAGDQLVDLIAWGGAGDIDQDDPGIVGPVEFRVVGADDASDDSLQAGADFASPWSLAAASPGALNAGQVDGGITLSALAPAPVPLPASVWMLGTAALGLSAFGRRRDQSSALMAARMAA